MLGRFALKRIREYLRRMIIFNFMSSVGFVLVSLILYFCGLQNTFVIAILAVISITASALYAGVNAQELIYIQKELEFVKEEDTLTLIGLGLSAIVYPLRLAIKLINNSK